MFSSENSFSDDCIGYFFVYNVDISEDIEAQPHFYGGGE